jgi:hypothetical protein
MRETVMGKEKPGSLKMRKVVETGCQGQVYDKREQICEV